MNIFQHEEHKVEFKLLECLHEEVCPLVLEIQCPQNNTDRPTDRHIFSKNGQIVFRSSQKM